MNTEGNQEELDVSHDLQQVIGWQNTRRYSLRHLQIDSGFRVPSITSHHKLAMLCCTGEALCLSPEAMQEKHALQLLALEANHKQAGHENVIATCAHSQVGCRQHCSLNHLMLPCAATMHMQVSFWNNADNGSQTRCAMDWGNAKPEGGDGGVSFLCCMPLKVCWQHSHNPVSPSASNSTRAAQAVTALTWMSGLLYCEDDDCSVPDSILVHPANC